MVKLVFGINGMFNRPNSSSPWDPSNTVNFLDYTARNSISVYGFELGNELTTKVLPDVLGKDFILFHTLVAKFWPDAQTRPRIIGPDLNPNSAWLNSFLSVAGPVMDVITYHLYIGYGLNPNLTNQLQDPSFLDLERQTAMPITESVGSLAPHAEIWAGETAAAWHSGQQGTTNTFISSIWYVDQLGSLAILGHKAVCRQCLVGGFYGLLNWTNVDPNPDFFTALLWKSTMGTKVLKITPDPSALDVRVYAHCSAIDKSGITLAVINLNNVTTYNMNVRGFSNTKRHEYRVSSPALESNQYFINSRAMKAEIDGTITPWTPIDADGPLTIRAHEILFASFYDVGKSACAS
eukprot:TRINITY_DN3294_c0_g1_i1.p1 TRINITY_DN3294_c0_g1~~TRINITY_DN3294_c0_g1_i1.p1  ORF type:complete len:350 (-),score=14.67 TRINITY_DN3294_c0_g1_i1:181-1230(-)